MSQTALAQPPVRRRFAALALCVAVGLFIGFMCGLTLARRWVPAPTEARLVMQLLALEHATLLRRAEASRCEPIPPARITAIRGLVDLVPLSLRDTLVVDAAFERKVQRLRHEVERFAEIPAAACAERRRQLVAIDRICRDCHLEYRAGESTYD